MRKLKQFFTGGNSEQADFESQFSQVFKEIKALQNAHENLTASHETLKHIDLLGIQKVGLVKFNPLDHNAGNLSFSLVMMDAKSTGLIITNMHGREQNRLYIKEIDQGIANQPLSNEEKDALSQAEQKWRARQTL